MALADFSESLAYDAAFWLTGFEEPDGFEVEELGRVSVDLCAKLRALAIIALLVKGDSDKFLHSLIRSGRVRETFQMRLKQAGIRTSTTWHLAGSTAGWMQLLPETSRWPSASLGCHLASSRPSASTLMPLARNRAAARILSRFSSRPWHHSTARNIAIRRAAAGQKPFGHCSVELRVRPVWVLPL